MSSAAPGSTAHLFEVKSAQLQLVTLLLKSTHLNEVANELQQRYGNNPDFFAGDPLLIDLSALRDSEESVEWSFLLPLLRRYHLVPVAVKGGNPRQMQSALQAGLAQGDEATYARAEAAGQAVLRAAPVPAPEPELLPALIVDKPLRSGQQVYARGTDLVLLAGVSPGAEVIADGSIHCYGPLRGRAIAGAQGNHAARILASNFGPELVSIAGVYRTFDRGIPEAFAGKPTLVRLDGTDHTLNIDALKLD